MIRPLELFIGWRYARSREAGFFVSFITWASLIGVGLGVAVLITILSVMNGFEAELRDRLVSLSSHATITTSGGAYPNWREARTRALAQACAHALARTRTRTCAHLRALARALACTRRDARAHRGMKPACMCVCVCARVCRRHA